MLHDAVCCSRQARIEVRVRRCIKSSVCRSEVMLPPLDALRRPSRDMCVLLVCFGFSCISLIALAELDVELVFLYCWLSTQTPTIWETYNYKHAGTPQVGTPRWSSLV